VNRHDDDSPDTHHEKQQNKDLTALIVILPSGTDSRTDDPAQAASRHGRFGVVVSERVG
jgi:hypothetical protein